MLEFPSLSLLPETKGSNPDTGMIRIDFLSVLSEVVLGRKLGLITEKVSFFVP